MHVGAYGGISERILGQTIGATNPTSKGGELLGFRDSPSHTCGLQFFLGLDQSFGKALTEERDIRGIRVGSQATKR